MASAENNDNPVRIQPGREGWRWSVIQGGRVAAEGEAPDANTAERYGAFAAAAVASFGRIGRRY
jgi:hypothetical protein